MIESTRRRPAKTVDCLVRIAYGEHVRSLTRQQARQFNLPDIGILKLVDENESRTLPRPLQMLRAFGIA